MSQNHAAGQDVVAYCGKCKMMLMHVVHAAVNGVAKRVECKTCHAVHNYRAHEPGKAPKKSRSTTSRSTSGTSRSTTAKGTKKTTRKRGPDPQEIYENLVAELNVEEAVPYSARNTFESGSLVNHPKFGVGIVTEVLVDRKVNITFREGSRTLIHAR